MPSKIFIKLDIFNFFYNLSLIFLFFFSFYFILVKNYLPFYTILLKFKLKIDKIYFFNYFSSIINKYFLAFCDSFAFFVAKFIFILLCLSIWLYEVVILYLISKFLKIPYKFRVALIIFFISAIGLFYFYFWHYKPTINYYADFYAYRLVDVFEQAVIRIKNPTLAYCTQDGCSIIDRSDFLKKMVQATINCESIEHLFPTKILPGSGKVTTAFDPIGNTSYIKMCIDESMANNLLSNTSSLMKAGLKNRLVKECYCASIANDLQKGLDFYYSIKK